MHTQLSFVTYTNNFPPPNIRTHTMHAEEERRNIPMSSIENYDVAEVVARFLQVPVDHLERAICKKKTIMRGEEIISPLSAEMAQNVCDAFVKGIYGRLFVWIVKKINRTISKPKVRVVVGSVFVRDKRLSPLT